MKDDLSFNIIFILNTKKRIPFGMRLFLHCIVYFSKLVILHLLSKLLTSVVITAIVSIRVDQNVLLLTINCLWRYSVKTPLFKGDPWINFIESIILHCGCLA